MAKEHTQERRHAHAAPQQAPSQAPQVNARRRATILFGILGILLAVGAVAGVWYWQYTLTRVYIDKAEIYAPVITLSPSSSGVLQQLLVHEGDMVRKNMILAVVGGTPIRASTDGEVVAVSNTVGQLVTPATAVVQMVSTQDMRVIGHLDEDKGLQYIQPGMKAIFTADAFPGKQYEGVVSEVSPMSRSQDIVFSISDQRQEQQFDVKVDFDHARYPELKEGMSARIWVIK